MVRKEGDMMAVNRKRAIKRIAALVMSFTIAITLLPTEKIAAVYKFFENDLKMLI